MPSKSCINSACNARIDQEDKTCPRCGAKQSRKRSPQHSTSPPMRTRPAPASHEPSSGGGGGEVATASRSTAPPEEFVDPRLNYSAKAPRPQPKSRAGTRAPSAKPPSSTDNNKSNPASSDKPVGKRWSPISDAIETQKKDAAAAAAAEEKNKSKMPAVTQSIAGLSMAATAGASPAGYQPQGHYQSQPPVHGNYRQPPPQGCHQGYHQQQQIDPAAMAAYLRASQFAQPQTRPQADGIVDLGHVAFYPDHRNDELARAMEGAQRAADRGLVYSDDTSRRNPGYGEHGDGSGTRPVGYVPPESRAQSPAPRGTPPGPGPEGSGGKKKQ